MKEKGVIFRFLGDRKNLRGRYRNGLMCLVKLLNYKKNKV